MNLLYWRAKGGTPYELNRDAVLNDLATYLRNVTPKGADKSREKCYQDAEGNWDQGWIEIIGDTMDEYVGGLRKKDVRKVCKKASKNFEKSLADIEQINNLRRDAAFSGAVEDLWGHLPNDHNWDLHKELKRYAIQLDNCIKMITQRGRPRRPPEHVLYENLAIAWRSAGLGEPGAIESGESPDTGKRYRTDWGKFVHQVWNALTIESPTPESVEKSIRKSRKTIAGK